MKYECEFVGGFTAPVVVTGDNGRHLIGIARREDGKARCLFFHYDGKDVRTQVDPWLVAVRPVSQACRAYPIPILAKEKVL